MGAHFKSQAEFDRWLAKNPAAQKRLRLAASDGVPVQPAPPAVKAPKAAAWPRVRHCLAQATVWTCVGLTGLSALGLWTCAAFVAGWYASVGVLPW